MCVWRVSSTGILDMVSLISIWSIWFEVSSRQLNTVVLGFGGTSGLAIQIWEQLSYKPVTYSLRCGPYCLGNLKELKTHHPEKENAYNIVFAKFCIHF